MVLHMSIPGLTWMKSTKCVIVTVLLQLITKMLDKATL
jgi:hypothetical protein